MKKLFRAASINLLAGLIVLTFAGCVGEVYPEGSATYAVGGSASGYYDYDYYPGPDVYFYPQRRIYYWNDGARWRSGRRLPPRYHLREEEREHLRFRSREPWTERHESREFEDHREGEHRRDRD